MSEETKFLILLCTFLFGLTVRTSYELLKRAHRVNPNNALVFGVVFTAMCLLWASWFAMCPLDPTRVLPPDAIRILAGATVVAATVAALAAVMQLRGLENINHLVTTGVFARIRHPMYCAFVFWILGWSVFNGAPISLLAGLAGMANILYWRRLEEAFLESHYGEDYRKYRASTWL